MREKILFNDDWRLLVDPPETAVPTTKAAMYLSAKTERLKWGPGAYRHNDVPGFWDLEQELPAEPWEKVDLPHDYIIRQAPDPKEAGALGFFHYVPAWYRKHFTLAPEDAGRRLTLYFEGINGISELYLNGCFLKRSTSSYVPLEVDITDLARFDRENVIAVYTDPRSFEGWWYAGGGIHRNVWLVKTAPLAVDLWGVFVPVRKETAASWRVPAEVTLRNIGYEAEETELRCEILAPGGEKAGEILLSGTVPARGTATLRGETRVDSPLLWDLDAPNLYTLKVTVSRKDGAECDAVEQRFGFREIEMTPDRGLFLNGRHVKIKGVCAHQDYGLTGKAVPDNLCRHRVSLFREMGANAFRASHYPHPEATMDACDEQGLLVMDETRRYESNEEAVAQLEAMVRRDRNHPSVFLWSTGNEEMAYHGMEQGHRIHRALEHVIRRLDPTRPVTTAITNVHDASVYTICEVIGINYNLLQLDDLHRRFPEKPFVSSENCAVGSTRGWYWGDSPERGYMDARDFNPGPGTFQFYGREQTWKFFMERPWISGGFQWDAIEHRGEAIWPRLCSCSGALDLFLQKKEAFYQNQSHWLERPMIHLLPHWSHPGFEGMPIRVWAYTNCDEAELFLNGVSLGRKRVEKYLHVEWLVPYAPGKLEVTGYLDGRRAAGDVRETAGPGVALALKPENGPVAAGGNEIALFVCTVLDAEGREVPDASPLVRFDCSGAGTILGTGSDNTDPVPVPSLDRRMYAGRIAVAIRPGKADAAGAAKATLIARSESLRSAYLPLEFPAPAVK